MNYLPQDNSYCINKNTGEDAYLIEMHRQDPEEYGAQFEIVNKPYKESVSGIFSNKVYTYTFIDIKSSKTGNIYRTLYFPNGEY